MKGFLLKKALKESENIQSSLIRPFLKKEQEGLSFRIKRLNSDYTDYVLVGRYLCNLLDSSLKRNRKVYPLGLEICVIRGLYIILGIFQRPLLKKIIFCLGLLVFLSLISTYSLTRAQGSLRELAVKKVEYTSKNLRDPFQSPFEMTQVAIVEPTVEVGLSHLQVQGIVWGSKMPQAIINNTVVKVGEVIDGTEILDIRKEGVYVLYEKRQYILRPIIMEK